MKIYLNNEEKKYLYDKLTSNSFATIIKFYFEVYFNNRTPDILKDKILNNIEKLKNKFKSKFDSFIILLKLDYINSFNLDKFTVSIIVKALSENSSYYSHPNDNYFIFKLTKLKNSKENNFGLIQELFTQYCINIPKNNDSGYNPEFKILIPFISLKEFKINKELIKFCFQGCDLHFIEFDKKNVIFEKNFSREN